MAMDLNCTAWLLVILVGSWRLRAKLDSKSTLPLLFGKSPSVNLEPVIKVHSKKQGYAKLDRTAAALLPRIDRHSNAVFT
jgi:hypothetical protein